ncbi:unnamed protein product [Fusarium venenatum]|uniref:Uncharacterized protein n=1 Tax=Fusarium venenatum TaxID=56646 RepID=A0A2L2T342_9HYPO|nr:uncharacterized protein FVRRES_06439 [Fusarium venenatum]CEI62003.1 unnamed protein product [Fusarium venenatum]
MEKRNWCHSRKRKQTNAHKFGKRRVIVFRNGDWPFLFYPGFYLVWDLRYRVRSTAVWPDKFSVGE